MPDFIHNDPEFKELLAIVSEKERIDPALVEKDYWIMHILYGLNQQGIEFELKGGTSLSKGFGLIHRFSEDIDIHIKTNFGLPTEGKDDKSEVREGRKAFYDLFSKKIEIDGIIKVERDTAFDDTDKYRSGGIRLYYNSYTEAINGLKDGILLEAGFDTVAPNRSVTISSWVMDHVKFINKPFEYIDNTALNVLCYLPGYTLVEKIQTIVNKYRKETQGGQPVNFMRQYYDVYCLMKNPEVQKFIGSPEYLAHKMARFRGADKEIPLPEHPALLLNDQYMRKRFEERYRASATLYYREQPSFDEITELIQRYISKL
ncbi:MAG: nucleotidyl transferase AbiEii/AbiGii toxin family protein [Bacteroidales bacterium]|nr:nucleotidyl transferase AbiEii/AbiGii toxin family protein [Bacteroidales bacterium]